MVRTLKFSHLFLSMSVLALAACGGSHGGPGTKTAAPQPPVSDTLTVSQPPVALTSIDETTDPVLVPLNAPLPQVISSEDRLARLEQAVASLRTDYETIMPAFAQLNVTNTRVQALLDQIEAERTGVPVSKVKAPVTTTTVTKITSSPEDSVTEVQTETVKTVTSGVNAVPVAIAPIAVPVTETVATSTASAGKVQAVRLGEHPGKTRIVVDLAHAGGVTPSYDLDNSENLLVIDLPGISAQDVSASLPKPSGIVAGMTTSETAGGSNLVIQLKKDAKVILKEYVKADGKQPAKLVFDIGAAS